MRISRRATAILIAAAIPLAGAAVAASPAQAASTCDGIGSSMDGTTFNGCVIATAGLNVRSHSGLGNVSFGDPPIDSYTYDTRVYIHCFLYGPSVSGPYGPTNIWDAIRTYVEPGQSSTTTYVDTGQPSVFAVASDAWIYTGTNNPIVPQCNGHN